MLNIRCPFCGERNETEFIYGGPIGSNRPDPATCSDEVWLDYLLNVQNPVGPVEERWWHARGCGDWFTLWRHTVTHEITDGAGNE